MKLNHLKNYDKFPESIKKDLQFIVDTVDSIKIPKDKKILDIGTGRGKMAIILASMGYKVITGEPEGDHWANWEETAKEVGLRSQITFNPLLAEDLPFKDNFFDLITMYGSFHHIENRPEALQECLRILKPNGSLVIF